MKTHISPATLAVLGALALAPMASAFTVTLSNATFYASSSNCSTVDVSTYDSSLTGSAFVISFSLYGQMTYTGDVTFNVSAIDIPAETDYTIIYFNGATLDNLTVYLVDDDFTYTFENTLSDTTGVYTATANLSAITVSSVPEPATATLSLLALAGLAARRRRK